MSTGRVDPRIARTRQRLNQALFDLVQQRRWDTIRVQDILDRAGISRSAFYAHYDGKFGLLTAGLPELANTIADNSADATDLLALFEHLDEAADVLHPLLTRTLVADLAATFHRCLVEAWTDHLADTNHTSDPVMAEYLAGALTATVRSYLTRRHREPPAAIAASCERHTRAVLHATPAP